MCVGGRLLADFTAGGATRPDVPDIVAESVVQTTEDRWVVWAHKIARASGDGFLPLIGDGGWYPRVAVARCRRGGPHDAPEPSCTCGFHAMSASGELPRWGLLARGADLGFQQLEVALSGRVLAFEARGGVLFRAAEQAVLRVEPQPPAGRRRMRPAVDDARWVGPGQLRWPDDSDGDRVRRRSAAPRGCGPVRLRIPSDPPTIVAVADDAGLCHRPMAHPEPARSLVPA
jgi:hypothetical protein